MKVSSVWRCCISVAQWEVLAIKSVLSPSSSLWNWKISAASLLTTERTHKSHNPHWHLKKTIRRTLCVMGFSWNIFINFNSRLLALTLLKSGERREKRESITGGFEGILSRNWFAIAVRKTARHHPDYFHHFFFHQFSPLADLLNHLSILRGSRLFLL